MLSNTTARYGAVTKTFHWTIALGIFAMIPLGIVANGLAHRIEAGEADLVDRARLLFSLHKTIGVVILAAAVLRIAWAISQPKPVPLHPERRVETLLAATVHWLLYGSLVLVPLSGWAAHAATEGFAPIWWPFGQDLPLVPESASAEHLFASLHIVFERVLVLSILLHVAGALKHHLIDKDATLRRMTPGQPELDPAIRAASHPRAVPSALAALAVWVAALGIGGALGLYTPAATAAVAELDEVQSDWTVEEGTLGLSITQFGSTVTGSFSDWTARIAFSEEPDADGAHGEVEVVVAIASLTLGTVSQQAMGADFFAADAFPTATVAGTILAAPDGAEADYVLSGTIAIKDAQAPLELPFTLTSEGDRAVVAGRTVLDRRDFAIGGGYPTEESLAFAVEVSVDLVATRAGTGG